MAKPQLRQEPEAEFLSAVQSSVHFLKSEALVRGQDDLFEVLSMTEASLRALDNNGRITKIDGSNNH